MLSENAVAIYKRLYFSEERGETKPEDVHKRVADFVASVEEDPADVVNYRDLYAELMNKNCFRPNSPAMMNAGLTKEKPILSACFVGHLEDDLLSILNFDREAAIIFSYGAGIGINWGVLREKDAPLSGGGQASGPLSFMKKLNSTADCVKSGGRARRAAIWSGMTDTHPDLLDFIECKAIHADLAAMNLSVTVTDAFMDAVRDDAMWELKSVLDGSVVKTLPAREIFRRIVETAHKTGDPGLIFIDRVNKDHCVPSIGPITATNPCGELPMPSYGSCCLGSINLAKFYDEAKDQFDYDAFGKAVQTAVRFLDSLIDVQGYPTEKYEERAKYTRNIGLGIMGLADLFLLKGIRYGNEESVRLSESIAYWLTRAAIEASVSLAMEKGPAPAWESEENRDAVLRFVETRFDEELASKVAIHGVRNMQWTTIAPTGSISLACDCSQGMEPYFALVYEKRLTDTNQTLYVTAPAFQGLYQKEPWYNDALKKIAENKGSCQGIKSIPRNVREIAVCAHDILPSERLAVQAALQKYISSAISSTVNLPHSASPEEIERIYLDAHALGLKGITVYRDGAHADQPVLFGASGKTEVPKKRPTVLYGKTHRVRTAQGNIYLTVNCDDDGRVVEIFTNGGKNGTVDAANLEALARVMSIALQEGADLERLSMTLLGINGGESVWTKLEDSDEKAVLVSSIPDAVGKVLLRFYVKKDAVGTANGKKCPECGSELSVLEGCLSCVCCGWSKCS
jgi:ribonucleoside-diphosphate reductase alpha chain